MLSSILLIPVFLLIPAGSSRAIHSTRRPRRLRLIQIPLTPEQFAAASAQLQEKQGIVLTGTEGKLSKMGVTASYVYKDGLLTVEILEKPFFVSTEYCEEQLRGFLSIKA